MKIENDALVVVVLGMHRSGTSVVARGLQVMGVDLGDRLMPPNPEVNAKGFWEDIDLNALNIEMLHAIGSDWNHLEPIDAIDVEALHKGGYFHRAVELIQRKVEHRPVFGFKDPRVAKLLIFWKEVFSFCKLQVRYVLAVRHPLSVVRSLEKRDGFDALKCYMLWLEHVIVSLSGTNGCRRVLVDYDRLMRSAEHELSRISEQLDLSVDPVELHIYKTDFLDEGLRHTAYELNDLQLDEVCPPLVFEVYEALLWMASDDILDEALLQGKVDLWRHEFKDSVPLLGLVDRLTKQNAEYNSRLSECKTQLAERDEQVTGLNDEIVRRGEWAMDLASQLKEAKATIAVIQSSTSWQITKPMREMRRWIRSPSTQAKHYLMAGLSVGRNVYYRLPISVQLKIALKGIVARYFRWMLRSNFDQSNFVPALQLSQVTIPPIADQRKSVSEISLMTSSQPVISVVIPVYGQCEYTLMCLLSITAHRPKVPYEIIVVDDCSPDDTFEILQEVNGIKLIRNSVNLGFIRSCNLGSRAAKGRYVYFLNNDTQVTPGWLEELIRTFDEFPGTGLAGSKLVYPNGTLQEAGGIIWRDGSAWNFGRNQDPSLPVYNYAREVDYCSGASIMVPKVLFDELGCFDEHYLPAYCEDADLALKIRVRGYRVIYQPLSVVVHFEGITSGTDTASGVKAYQVDNSRKLFERWQGHILNHQLPGERADDAKDRCAMRRVLVIDHCTPTPNQDAGSVTVLNLLLLLREMNFQVTFIPEDNFLNMQGYTSDLQRRGIEVLYEPYVHSVEQHLQEYGQRYQLALLFRPSVVEQHLKAIRKFCPYAKVLFHTVDLHYLRMSREADMLGTKLDAVNQMKQREFAAIRAVDASIVHSTAELDLLRPELPNEQIYVYPLILNVGGSTKTFKERRDIVFVGGYQHTPNVDAVKYFVAEIMPIIRVSLPGVRFHIVGSKPPPEVQALAAVDVVVVGFVDDLNILMNKMRVSVAPLRFGAGIKGKIGTAMAVGLPIVATSMAAEGMSLSDGENILVADGAENFSKAVVRLYQDESLWSSISESSIRFADSAWGGEAAWKILASILADMGIETRRGSRQLTLYSVRDN